MSPVQTQKKSRNNFPTSLVLSQIHQALSSPKRLYGFWKIVNWFIDLFNLSSKSVILSGLYSSRRRKGFYLRYEKFEIEFTYLPQRKFNSKRIVVPINKIEAGLEKALKLGLLMSTRDIQVVGVEMTKSKKILSCIGQKVEGKYMGFILADVNWEYAGDQVRFNPEAITFARKILRKLAGLSSDIQGIRILIDSHKYLLYLDLNRTSILIRKEV